MNKQLLLGNLLALLLFGFVSVGCGGLSPTANNPKELENFSLNTTSNSREIKSENRLPIIEIWQDLKGSVAIEGKSLYFRMYDDEMIEFEYVIRKKNESGKPLYLYSIQKLPSTKISADEFSRTKSLSLDLLNSKHIKQEYQSVGLLFDVSAKLTILLRENDTSKREIIINNSDLDVIDTSFQKNFPKLLVDLIKEIHLIREKLQKE